ncbi:hypothetical protein D3C73_731720 [compost metagenome]
MPEKAPGQARFTKLGGGQRGTVVIDGWQCIVPTAELMGQSGVFVAQARQFGARARRVILQVCQRRLDLLRRVLRIQRLHPLLECQWLLGRGVDRAQ